MRLLLDTHTLLWLLEGDARLSPTATGLLVNCDHELLLSPASYWELAIKVSLGKYQLADPIAVFIREAVELYRLTILPITPSHAQTVANLPFHHKDPFDRMLIAQAIVENIPIVSADSALDAYAIERQW